MALAVAVTAAGLLNVALVGSFIWSDLFARQMRIIGWVFLGVAWSVSAGVSAWRQRREESQDRTPGEDWFGEALDGYLKGNWVEAERLLGRLLERDRRDLEARLMLATLLRRTKRFDEATRQLNHLVRMEGSQHWALEIRREGELLTEARQRTITSLNTEQANYGDT
jgi:predicted Zn-dependent protease